ncbi:MAG: hypothetical protein ABI823_11565 [Bryobacteraceae bacterium]
MTRQERRAVNRANAKLSTGPATAAGLEVSKMNAVTHGLTAAKPYLPTEQPFYEAFAAAQLQRLAPQTPIERELADTIIDATWRIRRIPSLEARLFDDPESDPHKVVRSLDTLSRHELRLRKLLAATTTELQDRIAIRRNIQKQQALPAGQNQNGFVSQNAVHAPIAASPTEASQPHSMPPTHDTESDAATMETLSKAA